MKLTQNAIFGRCCMNPDKFRNTNAYVDPAKFERAVGKSSVTNFELQINDSEGFLAFVETLKTDRSKACMSVPTQVGARTLQLSKLMMEKAYYLHMRRLFPKMRLLFTDTDSVMVHLNGATLFDVAGKSKDPETDLSALSAAARASTWACAPRCTASSRSSPTARARRRARSRACRRRRRPTSGISSTGRRWRKAASAGRPSRSCAAARVRSPWRPSRRSRSRPSTTRSTASTLTTRGCWDTGATWSSCGCWALTLRQGRSSSWGPRLWGPLRHCRCG